MRCAYFPHVPRLYTEIRYNITINKKKKKKRINSDSSEIFLPTLHLIYLNFFEAYSIFKFNEFIYKILNILHKHIQRLKGNLKQVPNCKDPSNNII